MIKILSANEKWIPLEPTKKNNTSKKDAKLNIDLSKIEPINKMMRNVTIMKQLFDATTKKEKKAVDNDKNWFILKEESKD